MEISILCKIVSKQPCENDSCLSFVNSSNKISERLLENTVNTPKKKKSCCYINKIPEALLFLQGISHLAEYHIFSCEISTLLVIFQLFTSFLSYTLRLFHTLDSLEILFNLVSIIWYQIYFNKYYTCYSR